MLTKLGHEIIRLGDYKSSCKLRETSDPLLKLVLAFLVDTLAHKLRTLKLVYNFVPCVYRLYILLSLVLTSSINAKTRAELEEIALAEADVARLKQKVAELHHQLSQQRHHHLSSLPDAQSHHQFLQNHNTQL